MIPNKFKTLAYSSLIAFITTNYTFSQEGNLTISQDENITVVMNMKENLSDEDTARYKIQIYNGNRQDAYKAQNEFKSVFSDWEPSINFEQPNFKIWVGNFRTRLEADRALKKIKGEFPSAFIFKPKKQTL